MIKLFIGLLLLCGLAVMAKAQEAPFANEIRAFNEQDSLQPPPAHPILFVGSSSFRLWSSLQHDFSGKAILNRGFGGATILDVERYAAETIYRYQPAQIIFYCGENDLASSDTITAQTVVTRFTSLFRQVRSRLPGVPFVFVSMKPSPSRAHRLPQMAAANASIRKFLKRHPHTAYVDVFTPMLDKQGKPRPELFTADNLHMNRQGYDLWMKKIRPVLK